MKKLVSLLMGFVMITAMLTACSGNGSTESTAPNSAEPVEVIVWNTFSEHQMEAFQTIVDGYNASQSEVNVVVQAQANDEFDKKLMQAVRNGTGPDIALDYAASVANYLPDGFVVNLSQYIDDPEIGIPGFKDAVAPGIYAEATQFDAEGNVYVMPVVTTGTVMYYNKTLYDEMGLTVPTTWDELVANCEKIKAEKDMIGFGFDNLVDGAQILLMQSGSNYYNKDTDTVDINTPATVATYEDYASHITSGIFKLRPDSYFNAEFGAQDIASYISSVASFPYCKDSVNGSFEIGAAPIPQGKHPWAPAWNRGAIVFTSDDATQRAAFSFLKYFTSPEVNAKWCQDFGALSAYPAVNEAEAMKAYLNENVALTALAQGLENVGYIPAFTGSNTVRDEISKALQECSTGMKTAAQALEDAAAVCDAELAGN